MATVEWIGKKELIKAIERNPKKVLDEARLFFSRGLAEYKKGIVRSPWRVGATGGGAPVSNDPRYYRKYYRQRSGNLRDTHETQISGLQASIGPNQRTAPYARFVHDGTSKMRGRPWLDHVKQSRDGEIRNLYRDMLKVISGDLAK